MNYLSLLKFTFFALRLASCSSGYSQTVFNFTSADVIGANGPTQAILDLAYAGTNLAGNVTNESSSIVRRVSLTY